MQTPPAGAWKLPTLNAILLIEAVAMAAIVGWLLIDLVTLRPSSYATAIALLILTVIGAIFIWVVAVLCLRRNARFRGGAVIWQLIQLAVAIGSFQGVFAQPLIGWVILVPSLLALVLSFSKPVTALVTADARAEAERVAGTTERGTDRGDAATPGQDRLS